MLLYTGPHLSHAVFILANVCVLMCSQETNRSLAFAFLMQQRISKKGLILGVTPPHGRTSCNHIFIEGTCIELQKRMVVKFYFGGSYILQSVIHVEHLCPCLLYTSDAADE